MQVTQSADSGKEEEVAGTSWDVPTDRETNNQD